VNMTKTKSRHPPSRIDLAEGMSKDQQVKKAKKVLKKEKESCEFRITKLENSPSYRKEKQENQIKYLKQRKKLIEEILEREFSGIRELLEKTKQIEEKMDNPKRRALRQGILSEF